ncbi:MAG: hypothetical protein MR787_03370 [Bacteroidales bacterium]|nr:hypothetical protein [Bacteroidales bacterium]
MKNLNMSTFKRVLISACLLLMAGVLQAQQLPNASFEDWSGAQFDGNIQPASWNVSNVTQFGFKFNFAYREAGHTGSYCLRVQDREIGAAGITEVSPGYFSLGQPWVYIESLTKVSYATAGTEGGMSFTYRPDSMSVWIKRTGNNTDKEDFYLLYYAWSGTAKSSKYKGKNSSCTSVSKTNEESDIRIALDGNECGTDQKANQIAEGMWRERKTYGEWTNIKVPIYYFNNDAPTMMNIIFSASNYPNYRANSGLYDGNSLWVDDVSLIYSSKIQKLYIDDKEWKGFDPNNTGEQVYSLGQSATTLPKIEAKRGIGTLTNAHGETANFTGRTLSGKEITITNGEIDGAPTTITVRAEDGSSTTTYKIKFVRAASTNSKLAGLSVNGEPIAAFNPNTLNYTYELPYGTTDVPVVSADKAEDGQTVSITQPTSTTGKATVVVTAADKKTTSTYTIQFAVALLSDNTLKDIKVNGNSLPGFTPTQTIYRVSLPEGTTDMPDVEAVSAYPDGAQTIDYLPPAQVEGGQYQISVTTPGNPVAKVYKLNFKLEASSYTYLADLQMGGYITDFQPEVLTYYVNLHLGTTELPEVTYVPGDPYQTITVEEGGLDGTTRVIVTAANGDQSIYKIIVSTEKSDVKTLQNILLDGVPLEGFSPDKVQYNVQLPIGTEILPAITVKQGDEYQTVSIVSGGLNGTTRITVTAGNGETMVYQITFSVEKATNNTLRMITLDGVDLEGFNPEVDEYTINLPMGTTKQPEVGWTPNDEYQTISVRKGTAITDDVKITVRPQSGTSRTYTLHFTLEVSGNTALAMIYLDGDSLQGFHADTLHYTDTLPAGVSEMPEVTYDKGDETQKVLSITEGYVHTLTVTAPSGAKQIYTITFVVQKSENAFLKMIYLDGDSLPDFDKNVLAYEVELTAATCPVIAVDKENGQQVTITTPYGEGTARIRVQPEQGAANTYTILFKKTAQTAVQLQNILLDGVAIEDFSPVKTDYAVDFKGTRPVLTWVAGEGQTVQRLEKQDTVLLVVSAGADYATYTIAFRRTLSNDATLAAILLDSVALAEFVPTNTNYTINLPAGATMPVVTYQAGHPAQTIVMGGLEPMQTGITVQAENGAETTYTVTFAVALYSDATLADLQVEGHTLGYQPTQTEYTLSLDEGMPIPALHYTAREGQRVVLSEPNNNEQRITVTAENETTITYIIEYTRTISGNALLADILLDGVSLADFAPDRFAYVDSLPMRTKTIPSVFPVGQLPGQTITTYFSAPDGVTTIHVVAPNGTDTQDYTIAFPVRKSSNAALTDLYLNSDEVELRFHPDTLYYTVLMPYQATEVPQMTYEASAEQTVEVVSRPLGEESKLRVHAEDGTERVYTVLFQKQYSPKANLLDSIIVEETGASLPVNTLTQTVSLPFGTRNMTIRYKKAFDEQTVWVQSGGINKPTILTVQSNRPDEEAATYTLTPAVATQDPATLTGITVDGTALADFDHNRFTYICNRTSANTPMVLTTQESGVQMNVVSDVWHWQAKVSAEGYENTYTIYFHYPNEVLPNGEFTEWTTTTYSGDKPVGWNAPSDYLDQTYARNVCQKSGESELKLVTAYNAGLGSAFPSVVNIADMMANNAVAGGSRVMPYGFIAFHNTPDNARMRFYYKAKNSDASGALFRYIFYDSNGTPHPYEQLETAKSSNYVERTISLPTDGLSVLGLDVVIDPTGMYPQTKRDCELYVDYLRFSYNSTLTGLKVNEKTATKSGNAFKVQLDSEETDLPTLSFVGEVSDQAQQIIWTEYPDSVGCQHRKATIINYAEDGTHTDYTLTVLRPRNNTNMLADLLVDGVSLAGFNATTVNYTLTLPANSPLPSVQPVLANGLQSVTTSFSNNVLSIKVTPEKGGSKTYKITFRRVPSNNTTLAALAGVPDFAADTRDYTINADAMPALHFTKHSDAQTAVLTRPTADTAIITVTAEDGISKGTYTITLQRPTPTTSGQIKDMNVNGRPWTDFSSTKYDYTLSRPEDVQFTRVDDADSVVFVQSPVDMRWLVYGSEQHTYTLTYPSTLSANAHLAAVLLDSVGYSNFLPSVADQTIEVASADYTLSWVRAEETQQVEYTFDDSTNTYTVTVTAEDSTTTFTYHFMIKKHLSSDATLQGIYVGGSLLPAFKPEQETYTYILPVGESKQQEPQMPSVSYQKNHSGQTVMLTAGSLGSPTYIEVLAEDGLTSKHYELTIQAEPSHCTTLTGILVNGKPIASFVPTLRYYSAQTTDNEVNLQWTSNDAFQTVTLQKDGNRYTIHVLAQDGINYADYYVDVYATSLSNEATLANIWLNGLAFSEFESALNPRLGFSPMQQAYTINLPSGTTRLPDVSATLKEDGQTVATRTEEMAIYLDVTAPDGVTTNTYSLFFSVPRSTNAQLGMIYVGDEELADFAPDTYYYLVTLPVGTHSLPEVLTRKAESTQTVTMTTENVGETPFVTIKVLAEDQTTTTTYTVAFRYTLSEADTLQMIYADGMQLPDFSPAVHTYAYTLPVDATQFPELSWDEADAWQTVILDTTLLTETQLTRRITVDAESGRKGIYTVTYERLLSQVDTLRMIFVDGKALEGFRADSTDYLVTIDRNAETMPVITYIEGAEGQTITLEYALAAYTNDSVARITVIAPNGNTRTYTIRFTRRLSDETGLQMIFVDGTPLTNFDEDKFSYRIPLPVEVTVLPMVTAEKKEPEQQVAIARDADTVRIHVQAEDASTATYTLTFEHLKSDNTLLADIRLQYADDSAVVELTPTFSPSHYDYAVTLPFGTNSLPTILPAKSDEEQTVEISAPQVIGEGTAKQAIVTITVTAPNEEDQAAYTITFTFAQNSDARLTDIFLRNERLEGFHPDTLEYTISYPAHSTTADFVTTKDVHAVLSDEAATLLLSMDDAGTILLSVTAQDGTNRTYSIRQNILLDTENTLRMIFFDDVPFEAFDPEQDFYTYYLVDGMTPPAITAEAMSDLAEISIKEVSAGDTCMIICTSESGESRRYRIWFAISQIDNAAKPTKHDVMLRRAEGSYQLFAATTRANVSIAIYNTTGKRLFMEKIPTANPNDVHLATDSHGNEMLIDVYNVSSGVLIDLNPNEIYYYTFFEMDKEVITSGKIILL